MVKESPKKKAVHKLTPEEVKEYSDMDLSPE